jgi:hypothetical protein
MAKVGRNEPCPCGSGKKAKHCCIDRIGAERMLDVLRSSRDQLAAKNERLKVERDELVHRIAELEIEGRAADVEFRVHELLDAGQPDEAEAVGRELEELFPGEETVGMERLAEVYESRGMTTQAVAHYRRAVARMEELGRGGYCDCCRGRVEEAIERLEAGRGHEAALAP